ncbi:hypothetical protein F5877DRAFT_73497, partial [Lentinula edodes]
CFLMYIVGALAVGIAVDIVNTISLILLLLKNKGMSMRSSRKTIDRLDSGPLTLETGLLTRLCLYSHKVIPHYLPYVYQILINLGDSATWVGPILFTAKFTSKGSKIKSVYSNALLASFSPAYAPSSSCLVSSIQDGTGIQFNGQSHNSGLVLRSFAHTTTSHIEATQDNERSTDVIKSDPEA